MDELYREGQQIMGRAAHRLGILRPGSPEDRRFRGYFGVSAEVALEAWDLMEEIDCLHPSPQLKHYYGHWLLCDCIQRMISLYQQHWGGSDPKTIRKYIWPMIASIFELDEEVVSS